MRDGWPTSLFELYCTDRAVAIARSLSGRDRQKTVKRETRLFPANHVIGGDKAWLETQRSATAFVYGAYDEEEPLSSS